MRYVTLRFEDQAGIVRAIRSAALPGSIRRGPVHHLNLLADGSMVRLESVAGDLRAYADALAASEAVHASSVVHGAASRTRADGDADRAGHAYLHYEPTAAAGAFVRWRRQFPIVLATPIEFDDEAVLVTLVGAVGNFTDATAALPDCLE